MQIKAIINKIPELLTISCIIDVCSYKPGNVSRFLDFEDVSFEDFIISSIAIFNPTRILTEKSYKVIRRKLPLRNIRIGYYMKKALINTRKYVKSNTNLGIVMLSYPLLVAVVYSIVRDNLENLSKNCIKVLKSTTYKDTIDLYKAIVISNANIPNVNRLNVYDENSFKIIKRNNINLYEIMKYTPKYDLIAKEYLEGYPITIDTSKKIYKLISKGFSLRKAVEHVYISLLSKYEDSHIIKTKGLDYAKIVKKYAKEVLDGRIGVKEFESYLIENKLNPGAIADIIVSSTFLFLIYYYAEKNNRKGLEIWLKY